MDTWIVVVIAGAIAAQAHTLEQVMLAGFSHQPAVELAETLLPPTPETAVEVVRVETGRGL
mgnify:CR=1 FL=1